jgi:hypothetical protein
VLVPDLGVDSVVMACRFWGTRHPHLAHHLNKLHQDCFCVAIYKRQRRKNPSTKFVLMWDLGNSTQCLESSYMIIDYVQDKIKPLA